MTSYVILGKKENEDWKELGQEPTKFEAERELVLVKTRLSGHELKIEEKHY